MSTGNRYKAQGTAEERRQRLLLQSHGFNVERLAEAGIRDLGDLRLVVGDFTLIIESKDVGSLNIHETVVKATRKAAGGGYPAAVWWKRKKRTKGSERRVQVGEPIVCMTESQFLELLARLR